MSRNPTEQNESTIKAKTLWDEWFTVNIVSEMKNKFLTNQNTIRGEQQPIKIENDTAERKGENANNDAAATLKQTIKNTLTDISNNTANTMNENDEQNQLQELAIKPPVKRPFTLALVDKSSKIPLKSSIQRIGENILAGTYESDQTLQTVIQLLKQFDTKKFKKLPKVWQNRFKEFSLDENDFIYVDERLVIPEELRRPIFRSLHWGHPGQDAMLQAVADIWWPQIHREIVLLAQKCNQCQQSGKNLKTLLPQTNYGKLPEAEKINDELALDFAGPFKSTSKNKQYLLVAIDHKTNWPCAKFTSRPPAEKVTSFLNEYIAQYGIPKRIRTDPALIFRGETFKQFCKRFFIKHIECPIRDHRGNGKIERLTRTINERIRAEKPILTEKGNAEISRLLFALRTTAATNNSSPFDKVFGQKPNTIKNLLIEKPKSCLENDNLLQLSPEDFPKDDDSTILMRNKTRNTKLEGQFAKKKGQIVSESDHTITKATPRGRQVISKRDVAKLKKPKSASHSPQTKQTKQQQGNSHSLERKIAALKEAAKKKQNKRETKQEQESTEKTDYKRKDIYKPIRSPRKQINPRKSSPVPPKQYLKK